MTAGWAAVLISALVASGTALGFVIRMTSHWTRLETRIGANTDRIAELARQIREERLAIGAQISEDRKANNTRLTWLERQMIYRASKTRGRGTSED